MKESIRLDIISILIDTIKAIEKNDLAQLRELSDRVINSSSIYQDHASISLAVIIYSIFKILEKKHYEEYKEWEKFKSSLTLNLKSSYKSLEKGDISTYHNNIKSIIESMNRIEKDMGLFIDQVMNSSKIKKAASLYLYGVSAGRAAEILGISQWDLLSYLSQNREYAEAKYNISKSIAERLAYAKRMFNLR